MAPYQSDLRLRDTRSAPCAIRWPPAAPWNLLQNTSSVCRVIDNRTVYSGLGYRTVQCAYGTVNSPSYGDSLIRAVYSERIVTNYVQDIWRTQRLDCA